MSLTGRLIVVAGLTSVIQITHVRLVVSTWHLLMHGAAHGVRRRMHVHVAEAHGCSALRHGAGHHDVTRKRAWRVRGVQAASGRGGCQVLLRMGLLYGVLRSFIERRMLAHGSRRITADGNAVQLGRLVNDRVRLRQRLAELSATLLWLLEELHVGQTGIGLTLGTVARA